MEKRNSIEPHSEALRRRAVRAAAWTAPLLLAALFIFWAAVSPPRVQGSRSAPNPAGPSLSSMSLKPQQKLDRKRLDQATHEFFFHDAGNACFVGDPRKQDCKNVGMDPRQAVAIEHDTQQAFRDEF